MEQLLPLGTIVKVSLGKKNTARLMIAGYYPSNVQTGKVYDYLTVMYPFGLSYQASMQMIQKSSIVAIEAMGYMDEVAEQFTKGLPELIELAQDAVFECPNDKQIAPLGTIQEQAPTTDEFEF